MFIRIYLSTYKFKSVADLGRYSGQDACRPLFSLVVRIYGVQQVRTIYGLLGLPSNLFRPQENEWCL